MQLTQQTKQVVFLTTHATTSIKQCGVCNTLGYDADICPYQVEASIGPEQVNVLGGYQLRSRYNHNGTTYNHRHRNYPNFSLRQNNSQFAQSSNPPDYKFH